MRQIKYAFIFLFFLTACDRTSTEPTVIENSWPPDIWNENLPEATEYDIVFQQKLNPKILEVEYDIVNPNIDKYYTELKRIRLTVADHLVNLDNAVRYQLPADMEASSMITLDGDFTGIPFKSIVYTVGSINPIISDKTRSGGNNFHYYRFLLEGRFLWPGFMTFTFLSTSSPGVNFPPLSMYAFCLDTDNDHSGNGMLHQYYYDKNNQLADEVHVPIDAATNTIVPENAFKIKLDTLPGTHWKDYRCEITCSSQIPAGYRCPQGIAVLGWVPGRHVSMFAGSGNLFSQMPVDRDAGKWITKEDSFYIAFCNVSDGFCKLFSEQ